MVGKLLFCFIFVILISCSTGTDTDAGHADVVVLEIVYDDLDNPSSSSDNGPKRRHSYSGFYKTNNFKWGVELASLSEKRVLTHASYTSSEEASMEWYVRWSVPSILEESENYNVVQTSNEYEYFLCDASQEDIDASNSNLIPITGDICRIEENEIENGEKTCGIIDLRDFSAYKKIGLCQSYEDGPTVLLAAIEPHVYEQRNISVKNIKFGKTSTRPSDFNEKAVDTFRSAVVNIEFEDVDYDISKLKEIGLDNETYRNVTNSSGGFIFIAAGAENSRCYKNIKDDIEYLKEYTNRYLFRDNSMENMASALVWSGAHPVQYWTFEKDGSICYEGLLDYPKRTGQEYFIGTINSRKGQECGFLLGENRKIRFNTSSGSWEIYGAYGEDKWSDDFSEIDHECHIMYDPTSKDCVLDRHIPSTSVALTSNLGSGFIAISKEMKNSVMLHELGHTLKLSDTDQDNNLMFYKQQSTLTANLRYTKINVRENDEFDIFNMEESQWNCLHNDADCAAPY